MTFHFTDADGDQLSVVPTSRRGRPGLLFLNARLGNTAAVHVPVDQVEDLVAGIRDTARQSAAQSPDT
ncbi:hypothetical protein HCJ99_33960, partial [Streptomyces sp. C1-2]|nr:hypothetical protein [Streptomyces sp. C1-2]